ncbi:MAG: rhodanese-like domain-containing protein [Nitrospinae bacterium]|nr:rhodanese-like domain-containing protein [Nitrospinota bacterium]MBF0634611.1 rhodanese-like domain-containing protein [Nitrospinota bacterium]
MLNSLFALFQQPVGDDYISPEDLKKSLDAGGVKALIDVRTPPEYGQARIPGARSVPLDNLAAILGGAAGQDDEVVVYCKTQNRSAMAARALAQNGFKNVKVLSGGITSWAQKGYPLEN